MNSIDLSFRFPARVRPLHVALVTETYPPEINGVAMTLGRMVDGLRDRGHRLQLIRPRQHLDESPVRHREYSEVLVAGLPIPRYPGLRFGLPATRHLRHLWAETRPDIVHVATQGPLGNSALAAARQLDIPVTSSFHTHFDTYSRHYGLGWLKPPIAAYLRRFHNRTAATLVPTHSLLNTLTEEGYERVGVLSRGVDTRLFSPTRRSEALRRQWGVGPGDLVVACVGRLAPEKNLGLLLTAFEEIRRHRPDARLLLVGDGPQRSRLAQRHPDIIFAGMRRGEDLATHYASADLFLFPSLTETFGNVTSEALASGLGFVGYDYAAASELIEDGRNGFLVPPGDAATFVAQGVRLAQDAATLTRFRLRAPASVSHLDWSKVTDQFAALLSSVSANHERRRLAEDALVIVPD